MWAITDRRLLCTALCIIVLVMGVYPMADGAVLTDKERLGKFIFFDTRLSSPPGQSCSTCHDPDSGFADPDKNLPVSAGVLPNRVGSRNSPTVTYLATAPDFAFDPVRGAYVGGQFWDGNAANLVEQAKAPFLNPVEMHMPNSRLVVHNVSKANYAGLFKQVYGRNAFNNYLQAYDNIADAIAAFERSPELNKFNSKFDLYLKGEVDLTDQELHGMEIFNSKGNCSLCHVSEGSSLDPPVFTAFRFANIGVPKNPNNPFYTLLRPLNPEGYNFIDWGLGGHLRSLGEPAEVYIPQLGRMGFPTLRNIAKTSPYFHNGVFADLKTVVHFFNTRDVPGSGFGPPEVGINVSQAVGNLGLTEEEEDALVAFMETLTDDYKP